MAEGVHKAFGYAKYDGAAAAFKPSTVNPSTGVKAPAEAYRLLLTTETQAIRYRDDGTDPTASDGFPVAVGAVLEYEGDIDKLSIYAPTGAVISILYYGI